MRIKNLFKFFSILYFTPPPNPLPMGVGLVTSLRFVPKFAAN